jgi:hypothetical protein
LTFLVDVARTLVTGLDNLASLEALITEVTTPGDTMALDTTDEAVGFLVAVEIVCAFKP